MGYMRTCLHLSFENRCTCLCECKSHVLECPWRQEENVRPLSCMEIKGRYELPLPDTVFLKKGLGGGVITLPDSISF